MKPVFVLVLLQVAFILSAAPVPLSHLDKFQFYGNDYVRIKDWARSNQFEFRWIDSKEIYVSQERIKLLFSADTVNAQLNGISVRLSTPVAVRNGVAYISPADLQFTIQPLLYPKRNVSRKIKTICIDPGHGGRDPGNIERSQQEKKYTLLLADELRDVLKDAGFTVVLTRSYDRYVDRSDRADFANRKGADLFLSLHFNSAERNNVKGVEVYCMTPAGSSSSNVKGGAERFNSPGNFNNAKNILLAYEIQKALVHDLQAEDRGVHRARFDVLREVKMPAVLIEGGFMTNSEEGKRIQDANYRKKLALSILRGVRDYCKIVEIPKVPKQPL